MHKVYTYQGTKPFGSNHKCHIAGTCLLCQYELSMLQYGAKIQYQRYEFFSSSMTAHPLVLIDAEHDPTLGRGGGGDEAP